MKQGWEIKKLGEVCSFSQGIQVPIEEQYTKCEEGMIRFLRIIDFTQKGESPRYIQGVCDKYILHDDEIAIVRYGTPGFVCYGESGAIANNLFKITQKKAYFNHNYLRYWLQSDSFQSVIKSNKYGVALKAIKFSTINDIPIPVPPLAEQERIVAELDCLSGVIEKKKQQLKELDALAQSIFYEMFGNPITNEKGWEVKKLGEVCSYITDGSHYSPKDDENGTIPMLSVKDMQKNSFSYENCKKIDENEYQKLLANGCQPLKGDVLISKDGSYFKYIFVVKEERKQALLSSIAITRPKIEMINAEYLVGYLYTNEIYNLVERELLTGTALKRVILKGLRELKILVPYLSLQQTFASKIEAIEKQKELIKQSIKEVETLFNSRMDYYFN